MLSDGHPIDPDETIGAVVTDSRLVQPGDLFVALPGERVDGHQFVQDAVRAGARAVLLSRPTVGAGLEPTQARGATVGAGHRPAPTNGVTYFHVEDTVRALGELGAYWRRKMPAKVIGITGSVGKTSTKEVLASVLSSRYVTLRSEKSYNNEIGLPLTLLALRPGMERAVLEMGGAYRMGELQFLCSLAQPSIGVVTNVGPVHLERMGTIERIAQTKAELVACLPADGVAILNVDDPLVRGMAAVARCPVLWYGLDTSAEVRADEIETLGLQGVRFRLQVGRSSCWVHTPLLGRHSVHIALAAAAAAHADGLDFEEIGSALRNLPTALRLIVNPGINGSTVIDDTYNASPASVLAALDLLAELEGRRIAVLGDMAELGSYAEEGHRKVGARAAGVCDLLYLIGPLSRITAEEAVSSGMEPGRVHHFPAAAEIEADLQAVLQERDIVLVKGSRAMALEGLAHSLSLQKVETR